VDGDQPWESKTEFPLNLQPCLAAGSVRSDPWHWYKKARRMNFYITMEVDFFRQDVRTWLQKANYPLVNCPITMERSTIFNGKTHYFDWAIFNSKLLVYQAGYCAFRLDQRRCCRQWRDYVQPSSSCFDEKSAVSPRWSSQMNHMLRKFMINIYNIYIYIFISDILLKTFKNAKTGQDYEKLRELSSALVILIAVLLLRSSEWEG